MNYLFEEIETIRQRPGLYIGNNSATAMYHYLGGFMAAMHRLRAEDKATQLLPLPFMFFNDYVSNHYCGKQSAMGWCSIILEKNSFDEEKSLEIFFELFSKFKTLSILHCQYAKLTEEAITFHYTSEYAPKVFRQRDDKQAGALYPHDYKPAEPLYLNPKEIYLMELSDAGSIFMVNTDSQHRVERGIYKSENEIKSHLAQCFGNSLDWNDIEMDNYDFCMELGTW